MYTYIHIYIYIYIYTYVYTHVAQVQVGTHSISPLLWAIDTGSQQTIRPFSTLRGALAQMLRATLCCLSTVYLLTHAYYIYNLDTHMRQSDTHGFTIASFICHDMITDDNSGTVSHTHDSHIWRSGTL